MTPKRGYGRRTGSMDALMTVGARNAAAQGISRRDFLRRVGGAGAVMLGGPALLSACGIEGTAETSATTAAGSSGSTAAAGGSNQLFVDNWILYIDTTEDSPDGTSTIDEFQAESGIEVTYTEGVNSNEEWFGKYQAQLGAGQATGFDIVVLTDYMAARMLRLGYAEQIDKANVPNAVNLVDALKSPSFDPERDFTMPWQSGFTGLAYDTDQTGGELDSWEAIRDPKFKGKVGLIGGYPDSIGVILLMQGKDPSTASLDDMLGAADELAKLVSDGQLRQVYGNEYIDELIAGNLAVTAGWSGDIFANQEDSPNLQFAFPQEGVMIWTDNMLIPKGAANKANAEKWMDFYYRPAVAAELAYWVWYVSPVAGAQEAMADIDEEFVDQPLIFPDEATLSQSYIFRALDETEETTLNEAVAEATGV
ncbi:MAG: spermidine/putrescine ABC transporter substrate-binding protein [Acidimicrobiia bacterium]|nr:spermidine/putrescine ABC transporter substrate-binding protein [Acidimicrobiia bacterium]MDH4307972.1 spermidine/putrescine ABC transporter substrate-binding protein [Acidimicrobiia bacterium]